MTQPYTAKKAYLVFAFILKYKMEHDGNSPSFREIGDESGISSTSMVQYYLDILEREGLLTLERGVNRMISITGGQWRYINEQPNIP